MTIALRRIVAICLAIALSASALESTSAQSEAIGTSTKIAAVVDVLYKNFYRLRKLSLIPLAVVEDGRDIDVTRWPGSLILDKVKSVEFQCGVRYRIVSLHSDYGALIALGKIARSELVPTEAEIRKKTVSELQDLLGPQAKIFSSLLSVDMPNPTYSIDAPLYVQWGKTNVQYQHVLLPPPYMRYTLWDWDARVEALTEAIPSEPATYARLKGNLSAELDSLRLFCPRKSIGDMLLNAHLGASANQVLRMLYDSRIRVGMGADEFVRVARKVLEMETTLPTK